MAANFLNNYFGFNKQQRNGLLVLSFISLLLFLIRIIYPHFITPDAITVQNLPLVERQLDSSYSASQKYTTGNSLDTKPALNLVVFDPNTVTLEQLLQMGFKERIAKTFLKFRSKGFVFKEKKDIQKVYGISDNFYAELEPYILIEHKITEEQKKPGPQQTIVTPAKAQVKQITELNSADSLALLEVNGIGPSFAKRILKYKSMLGGYIVLEQLKEVYGFTEEMFEKIKPFVSVNAALIKKINVNTDDFKVVNKHPYLSYELTKAIFNWRKKGAITAANLKEIMNDDVVYNKLLPYLQF